ncbi:MAG: carbohydrate ABC transporter permease [Chloroflexota bacterium]
MRRGIGAITAVLFLLPLYWALVASLRQPGLPPPLSVEWWPQAAHWQNYQTIFEIVPMSRYLRNSLLVTAVSVPLTLLTASFAGFSLSQMPYRWQRQLLALSIGLMMVPGAAVWLFRFQILRGLGLINSLWALIAPAFAASSPLFVLLFYWAFRRIPTELFEAARLDGATAWHNWSRLALPLVRPVTTAVFFLTFLLYWSDFVGPVLYMFDPQGYTLPVGLQLLKQLDATNWPLLMAGAIVMTLPILLLFAWLQRYFLHDLSLATLFDRN